MKKTVVLPPALGSYVNVLKPRLPPNSKPGDEPLYGIVLLYPKADADALLAPLRKAALEVAEAKWPGKGASVLGRMKYPVVGDGDERYPENRSFAGMVFVNAKRKESFGPPGVVDNQVQRVVTQDEVYSGCTVRAQVDLFPFDHPVGGKGVGVGLANIQVVRKGPRLDGREEPEQAFADFAEEPEVEEAEKPAEGKAKRRNPWDD